MLVADSFRLTGETDSTVDAITARCHVGVGSARKG